MSASAKAWLKRQEIEDRTLKAILTVLARRADGAGCSEVSQAAIAKEIDVDERTVRRSLAALEATGIISRNRKLNYQKRGRSADVVALALHRDFNLPKAELVRIKRMGPTGQIVLMNGGDLPDKMSCAPTLENGDRLYRERARSVRIQTSPVKSSLPCSTRIRFDRGRGKWRASLTVSGVTMDLGRFETQTEAQASATQAEADVHRTSTAPAGTPSFPVIPLSKAKLDAPFLGAWLFGEDGKADADGGGVASASVPRAVPLVGVGEAHTEYDAARAKDTVTLVQLDDVGGVVVPRAREGDVA